MEPLFINSLRQSKEIYIETNKAYSSASRIAYQIAVPVVYGFLAFVLIYFYYNFIGAAVVAAAGALLFFYPLIKLHRVAKKREKQLIELYGEIPEAQTFFYEDHILTTGITDKSEIRIEYGKIIKVRQSKNLYLLIMKQKLVVMVNKNRFEKGSCEEFEQFIKEKAVNAKIRL